MASEVDVEALEREARAVIDERGLGGLMVPCATVLGLVEALRVARERESYALAAIERNDEVHAEALRAVRQRAERAEQTRDAHSDALAQAAREAGDAQDRIAALTVERDDARSLLAHAERAIEQGTGACLLVDHLKRALTERDEARAALIRSQEDHRAAVEALETYEERIGDIADHVLGLVPPDVPSIVKLDAIERRCGEERVAARQAERERDEARAALATVNDIRNSIIGAQTVNWSEHVYPLVTALDAAGVAGMPYPEARENVGTLIERANKAEARVAELEAVLTWYATAPRDEDGATMPLDTGERARAVLAKRS